MRNNNIYGKSIPTKTTHWGWKATGWAIGMIGWALLGVFLAERLVG